MSAVRVCADRFDPADRALPMGLLNASASLGPAIAPLLLTPLIVPAGWRVSFAALGLAGLLVSLAWALVYRDLPAKEAAPRIAGPWQWVRLLRQRKNWGLLLGFAGTVYMTWLYVTRLPQFAGFLGAVGGGWLSDRLTRHTDARCARQIPLVTGLLVSALAAMCGNAVLALICISAALFGANVATTSGWALAAGMAPAAIIATVEAMANIGGLVGGSLAPLVTGFAVQRFGSFTPALLIASALLAFAPQPIGF